MRYDTLEKRLQDLFDSTCGESIDRVIVSIKCKTKDNMVYTMDGIEFAREKDQPKEHFRDGIFSETMLNVLEYQELVTRDPDGFRVSCHECVAVRSSEIIRVWADIEEPWVSYTDFEEAVEDEASC